MTPTQLILDVPSPIPVQHAETSKEAAKSTAPHLERLEQMVLDYLRQWGPASDLQMQAALGLSGDTQRPRRVALDRKGLIVKAGEVVAASGRRVQTWRAV